MTVFFDPFKVIINDLLFKSYTYSIRITKKSNFVKDRFPGVPSPSPWPLYNMFLFYDII